MSPRSRATIALAFVVSAVLACARRPAPTSTMAPLAGDAARVGQLAIPVSLVAAVAEHRQIPIRAALDFLVEDALMAQGARRAGLDREGGVAWACSAALARLVARRVDDEARARGAPSDDEVASVRVVHAVALRSPALPRSRGLAVAEAIARAVSGARDDVDFESRVQRTSHPGADVRVERLPEFDAGGRTAQGDSFDPSFVAAAVALRSPGETTGVVETPFGWHVIRLIERRKPDGEALGRKREALTDAVTAMRERLDLEARLRAMRQASRVELSAGADGLMAAATTTTGPMDAP